MAFAHELFTTERGLEPRIRQRFQSTDFISYTLTGEDVEYWHLFPLEAVAEKFYENADLWPILADANPVREPWAWKVGDAVLIPRDFQRALSAATNNSPFLRKLF